MRLAFFGESLSKQPICGMDCQAETEILQKERVFCYNKRNFHELGTIRKYIAPRNRRFGHKDAQNLLLEQTPAGRPPIPQGQPLDNTANSRGAMALTEQTKGGDSKCQDKFCRLSLLKGGACL